MITKYPYDVDLKNAIDLVQEKVSFRCEDNQLHIALPKIKPL